MGLYLLLLSAIWLVAAFFVSLLVTKPLAGTPWRMSVAIILYPALLLLPLIDEFIGGWQFEQLCKKNTAVSVDRTKAAGRTVYLAEAAETEIHGPWVRVVRKPWVFADVKNAEPLVSYVTLVADGGRLSRLVSEGGTPLTFKGSCEPGGRVDPVALLSQLQLTQVQRSALNLGDKK
ncbi:hypothetical protein [Caenimonas aquaedulcis]|uniref:Uncharacterized protein n=1 Tax=Caenimonas aquaedulcis TaxID=2793270 RepID=A0A931MFX6_9BURK|nr:hypothetical protein [Caenimonas aquaedulcis]MBG9387542.1 hypothetical protein [Caenimonas aquaedulcis]